MNFFPNMLTLCILSPLFNAKRWACRHFGRSWSWTVGVQPLTRQAWYQQTQPSHYGRTLGPPWKICIGPLSDSPLYQFICQAAWLNAGVAADERRMQIAGKSYRAVLDPSRPYRSLRLEVNEQFGFSTRSVKPCSGTGSKPLEHLSTVLDNNFHYRRSPLQARVRRVQLWHRRFIGYMPTWKHPLMALEWRNRTDVRGGSRALYSAHTQRLGVTECHLSLNKTLILLTREWFKRINEKVSRTIFFFFGGGKAGFAIVCFAENTLASSLTESLQFDLCQNLCSSHSLPHKQ